MAVTVPPETVLITTLSLSPVQAVPVTSNGVMNWMFKELQAEITEAANVTSAIMSESTFV